MITLDEYVCSDSVTIMVQKLFKRIFKVRSVCSPRLQRFLEELDSIKLGDDSHEYLKIVVVKHRFDDEKSGGTHV